MNPALLAVVAAVIWGLWWIPIHYLQSLGLSGALAGISMTFGAFVICVILALQRGKSIGLAWQSLIGAALVGMAISTYSVALTYSDVVRVVLLFYLAPAWSKIIEWKFLAMPWHWSASVTLAAALCGAYLVLGGDLAFESIRLGDVLAVLSGMFWAGGAALIFSQGQANSLALTLACAGFAVLAGLPFLVLSGGFTINWAFLPGMGLGMIFAFPILIMTLWSAQRLPPATISFLLTAEILSGTISGVFLLGEPFGRMQALGAALILVAALAETWPELRRRSHGRSESG